MSVKERLKKYIKHKKLTIQEFEKSIYASNGYVNSISKGIGQDKLNDIIEIYSNLNLNWLILGKGKMEIQSYDLNKIPDVLSEEESEYKNATIANLRSELQRKNSHIDFLTAALEECKKKVNFPNPTVQPES